MPARFVRPQWGGGGFSDALQWGRGYYPHHLLAIPDYEFTHVIVSKVGEYEKHHARKSNGISRYKTNEVL